MQIHVLEMHAKVIGIIMWCRYLLLANISTIMSYNERKATDTLLTYNRANSYGMRSPRFFS